MKNKKFSTVIDCSKSFRLFTKQGVYLNHTLVLVLFFKVLLMIGNRLYKFARF